KSSLFGDSAWAVSVGTNMIGPGNVSKDFLTVTGPDGKVLGAQGGFTQAKFRPPLLNRIPLWSLALAGYALLSAGGLALAARKLATPSAGER
ncbi:MAG: hypothetical protein LC792_12060, partial [Actinobacteria bacterium]|nr:hypothetical protein [Actinomycetota bacterium]